MRPPWWGNQDNGAKRHLMCRLLEAQFLLQSPAGGMSFSSACFKVTPGDSLVFPENLHWPWHKAILFQKNAVSPKVLLTVG